MQMVSIRATIRVFCTAALIMAGVANAQTPAANPILRTSGTVKASGAQSLTVTGADGKDVTVAISDTSKLVQVAPGSTNLSAATPIALGDIAIGDKVLVAGTAGDTTGSLNATRVVVMKSADIAQNHAAEEAAWQHGGGGLVQSVDPAAETIAVTSGARTLTVHIAPATQFHRYSGDSVKFEDAVASQLSDIRAGDQLRVRGTRSDDGSSIQADAIVTGSFHNFSGLLSSVDGTAGTVTLKDLATKKTVTVKVSANSDLRRIPIAMATRFAASRAPGAAASGAPAGGNGRAGADLSQMLSRLPTETLGGLKVGDAVMIVATQPPADSAQPTAVTLLAGVEPILQASPQGEMVLSPWGVGGGAPEGGGGQ
jgi:co-chaperonin GroES (HSP10)